VLPALVALGVLVFAAACGGPDEQATDEPEVAEAPTTAPAPPSTLSPEDRPADLPVTCDLLTDDEVAEIIGPDAASVMTDHQPGEAIPFSYCRWHRPDGSQVMATFVDGRTRYDGRLELAADGTLVETSEVDDVGDGALLAKQEVGSGPGGWALTVLTGDDTFEVLIEREGEVDPDEVVQTARRALDRL
jgi:hypothetical protein